MRRAALQVLKPYAEETVVNNISRVCPVKEIAFFQLGGGGADRGGGWQCVTPDEVVCGYGFHHSVSADSFEYRLFGDSLASEKIEVELSSFRHKFIYDIVDLLGGIKSATMCPYAVEDGLDVPCYSFKTVVEVPERFGVEGTLFIAEEGRGKFFVLPGVDGAERHELGALVERPLWRDEHGVHHVLFGTGKDEMRVGYELDVASEKRFHALFGEFANLLELVDGDRNLAFARGDVVERVLQGGLCLRRSDVEGELEGTVFLRSHGRAAALEEGEQFASETLGRGIEPAEDCGRERLHERREIFEREDVEIDGGVILLEDTKGVVDEASLSVAARRDERHVPAVGDCGNELLRLGGAVAEVFRTGIAAYKKRVVKFHARHYTINSVVATKFSRRNFRRGWHKEAA